MLEQLKVDAFNKRENAEREGGGRERVEEKITLLEGKFLKIDLEKILTKNTTSLNAFDYKKKR